MWFFEYKLRYYDDGDNCECEAMGLTIGSTVEEALKYICSWYGERTIIKVELEYIEDGEDGILETSNRKYNK